MKFFTFVKRSAALVLLAAALGGSASAMHSVDATQGVKASQRVQALYANFVQYSSPYRDVAPATQERILQLALQGFLRYERYQGLTSQECVALQKLINATASLAPVVKQVVRDELVHYQVSDRKDPMAFKAQGPTLALAVRDQQASVSAVPSFSSSTAVDATAKTVATTVVKPMPLPVVEAKSSVNTNKVKAPNRRLTFTNLQAKNTLEKAKLIANTDAKYPRVAVKAAVKKLKKPMPRVSSATGQSAPLSMSALSSSSAHAAMCSSDSLPCSTVAVDTKRPSCCARMVNACYNVSAYPLGLAWNVTKKTLGLGWDVTRWAAVNAYATLKYGVPLALVYRWYLPAINKVLANADPNMSQAAVVVYLAAVLGIPLWLAKKWYDRAQAA